MLPVLDFLYPSPLQFAASIPVWAGLNDGIKAFKKQEYALALHEFTHQAKEGDADAQFFMGSLYQQGDGVIKNVATALPWLEKAAKQKHHGALNALGVIYASEKEFRDYAKAQKCFEAAARQNIPEARYNLGLLLLTGLSGKPSPSEAANNFQLAAEAGIAAAQHKLGKLYDKGDVLKENPEEALQWYHKAAEQGYAQAQFDLGMMYHLGKGVQKNDEIALHWLGLAATERILAAQTEIAEFYDRGYGTQQDRLKAFYWYCQAAEQGNADAQLALGFKYALGEGVPQDFVLAYVWFNLSGAQGNTAASKERETVLQSMTPRQIEQAQELSRDYFDRYVVKPNVNN